MFKKFAVLVAAVAVVLGVAVASGPAPQSASAAAPAAMVSASGQSTCTTNGAGVCTIAHTLGVIPTVVQLTAVSYNGTSGWSPMYVQGSATATTFQMRVVHGTTSSPNSSVGVMWTVWAPASPPPTTTTTTAPTTTTTTTVPPTTTTTSNPPPPSGCTLPAYPDASCTGVPPGTTLTPYAGPSTITTAGTTLDSVIVSTCLQINAPGVTIKRSRINAAGCAPHVIFNNAASKYHGGYTGAGLTIQDSEVSCYAVTSGQPDPSRPTAGTGIGDDNMLVERVNIHGCENGFDMDLNAVVRDSYIHDLYQSEIAHTDGLQSADGTNLTVAHNTLQGDTWNTAVFEPGGCVNPGFCAGTSAININNCDPAKRSDCPTTQGAVVRDNLIAGGAFTLYCPFLSSGMQIIDNHFSYRFRDPTSTAVYRSSTPNVAPPWKPDTGAGSGAFGAQSDCQDEFQKSGNVYHETGTPVQF